MTSLVAITINQAILGTNLAHVARLATCITCRACYPTGSTVRPAALGTAAPTLLASAKRIRGLRLLNLTHCRQNLLWFPLRPELQLNFPFPGLLNDVIQGLAP